MGEVDWFPKARSKEIKVSSLFSDVIKIRSYGASYKIKWLSSNRVHPTLQADPQQKATRYLIRGTVTRPSIEHLKIISSFPLLYTEHTEYNSAWKGFGNSVPPLFMQAIAANIRNIFFDGKISWTPDNDLDYKDLLESAWNEHIKAKSKNAPTVISTFAGCGGSSLGYSIAGYKELLAVEWNDNAVATFKANFPNVPVYHGDITKLSVDECMQMAGLSKPGELDLLDGSPPCQGFSTAGKRKMDDDRNQLFREYVRLLRGLQPKVFVMENVSGLVKGKMKLVFAEIMRELKASGYKVKCKLLNAKYFHVPQSRQRLIFIGVRNDYLTGIYQG